MNMALIFRVMDVGRINECERALDRMMAAKSAWVITLLLMMSAVSTALAGDHERARDLLEQGEILSLNEIMKQANSRIPGKILEVELEEKGGSIVYEIEFLSEQGIIMEMTVDARTGKLISLEED